MLYYSYYKIEQILPEAIRIGKCEDIEDFRLVTNQFCLLHILNTVKELSQKVKTIRKMLNKQEETILKNYLIKSINKVIYLV